MVNERISCATPLRSRAVAILAIGVVSLSACASTSTPPPAYQVSTRKDAAPPLAAPAVNVVLDPPPTRTAGGPPTLAPAQPSIVGMPSARVNVSANGNDISEVIASVAQQAGLRWIVDPSIRGPVTTNLRNVSVNDAMMNLVGSQYQYRVQNGALVVGQIELVQKTYEVSYLQMARSATASTVVAHNLAGSTNTGIVTNASGTGTGVSSTSGGLVASGTDVIQSSSNADVWGELKVGLQTILFSGAGDSAGSKGLRNNSSGLGGAGASGECVGGTCLSISPFSSLVTVTANAEKQQQVADWLNMFKAAITRQVYITAKVVEVTLDRSKSYGIDWSAVLSTAKGTFAFTTDPASTVSSVGNASFNLGIGDLALTAVLNAVQSFGDVNVLASPATSAMNQQKASFNVTREVPFVTTTIVPTTFQNGQPSATIPVQSVSTAQIGIVLDVLPQISSDNIVTMSIRPSVTSLVSTQTVTSSGGAQTTLPTIDRRETDTMARVRSGETVMIGGLIQTQTTSDRSGIPILMNLPGIGKLFSHATLTEHHSEMVIFITPTITSGQPPTGR